MGEALRYCGALETLVVRKMKGLSDTAAAAVVAGLASCTSLQALNLCECKSLTALPDLSSLTSLQTLNLYQAHPSRRRCPTSRRSRRCRTCLTTCSSLTALPDLIGAHVAADAQPPMACSSLTALPDLAALTSLQTLNLGNCSSLTALPDLWRSRRCRRSTSLYCSSPHGAARPVGAQVAADALPRWLQVPHGAARPLGAHVDEDAQPQLVQLPHGAARPVGAQVTAEAQLNIEWCSSCRRSRLLLTALTCRRSSRCRSSTSNGAYPSRRCPTCRRSLHCRRSTSDEYCSSLTALPDLSALTDLKVKHLPDHLEPWKAGGFKAWSK